MWRVICCCCRLNALGHHGTLYNTFLDAALLKRATVRRTKCHDDTRVYYQHVFNDRLNLNRKLEKPERILRDN